MLPALITDTVTPDLERALRYALLWGLEAVVLRSVGGPADRVPHVNEARVRRRLVESELPVAAVDPGLFEGAAEETAAWLNDVAAFEETAAFCRRIGCDTVIVGALAAPSGVAWDARAAGRALARLARPAARAGRRLAVRNSSGTRCSSGEDLAEVIKAAEAACDTDAERAVLGAAWSPADAMEAGADPGAGLAALESLGAPPHLVVVRDFVDGEAGRTDVPPGEGRVDWPAQLHRLGLAGFEGPLVLEVRARPAGLAGLRAANALIALTRPRRPEPSSH